MSQETMAWLRNNIRIGYTDERGPAWWAGTDPMADGSHFDGPVPFTEVERLLGIEFAPCPITATLPDGSTLADPDRQGIVRLDTRELLGVFKSGYVIHPYLNTLAQFIRDVTDDSDVGIASVGLLRRGGVGFVQAKLPKTWEVNGYGYQPWITAATSVDGSLSTTYVTGADAAVCDNTLTAALAHAATKIRAKHTRNSLPRVADARERLGLTLAESADIMAEFITGLCDISVSDAQFRAWLDATVPMPEAQKTKGGGPGRAYTMAEGKRDELSRLYYRDAKVQPWSGTAFGVLQAANTYRTWTGIVRGADGGRLERNITNDITGVTAGEDAKALTALSDVLGVQLVAA